MARISDRRRGERRQGDRRSRTGDDDAPAPEETAPAAPPRPKGSGNGSTSIAKTLAQKAVGEAALDPPGEGATPLAKLPDERRRGSDRRGGERRAVIRRKEARVVATLQVDCKCEDNFLFATASNISSLGLFMQTMTPKPRGTPVELLFECDEGPFVVHGTVAWVNPLREGGDNPNPGMGITFIDVDPHKRERLLRLIRRIAYLADPPGQA